MIKVIGLLTRRVGLSHDEFVDYYESVHANLGAGYLAGRCAGYRRKFLTPLTTGTPQTSAMPGVDAILEMWFDDDEQLRSTMAFLAQPAIAEAIASDEERVFDRAKTRFFIADERVSDLSALPRHDGG